MEPEVIAWHILWEKTASWRDKRYALLQLVRPCMVGFIALYILYYMLEQYSPKGGTTLYQYQWGVGVFLLVGAWAEVVIRLLVALANDKRWEHGVRPAHLAFLLASTWFVVLLMKHSYDKAFMIGGALTLLFFMFVAKDYADMFRDRS